MKLRKPKKFNKNEQKSKKTSVFLYISGTNLEKWLNVLSQKGVVIYSAKKIDSRKSVVEVGISDEKNIEKFFKLKNIKVEKKKYNGFAKIIKTIAFRPAVLVGIFVAFCMFVFASNFVWGVEVWGNEKIDACEIQQVLANNGVGIFSPINVKTNEEIGKIVMENFNDVSMVSVVKKGTKIIVNLKEKIISDELSEEDKNNALVASQGGRITSIKLIQGTLLVEVGQIVKAGDALVAPYTIDSNGNMLKIQPKAEITADVWLTGESQHVENEKITVRTGNSVTLRKVVFLDKEIFVSENTNPFEKYEVETTTEILSSEFVPVEYVVTTFFEVEEKKLSESFEQVKEKQIENAKNSACSKLEEGDTIISENFVEMQQDGKTVVSYVITVSRRIDGQN